jgi:hypothetical protein
MEETLTRKPCPYEESVERELATGPAVGTIKDEAFKLSHLVQSGRRVSKDEMLEVEKTVRGPRGFLFK